MVLIAVTRYAVIMVRIQLELIGFKCQFYINCMFVQVFQARI